MYAHFALAAPAAGHRAVLPPRARRVGRGVLRHDDWTANRRNLFPRAARGDAPFGDDDDARVDSEEPYAATIESLLETEAAFPPHRRAWRWLECLSACGWVQGGADSSRVEVRESTKAGAGVFARTDIRRRTALGTYPGVRRSLADYCAKADRTNGRSLAYGLMCRDGWVLDPTDAGGGVAVRGFAEPANDVGGERGAYSYAPAGFSLFGKKNAFPVSETGFRNERNANETNETRIVPPTVSLFVPHGLREVWRSLCVAVKSERGFRVVADATFSLANEPDGADDAAGDLRRERRANIAVREGEAGVQTVYTLRDVRAGEELLWDYGASYDRSHYSTRGKAEESVEESVAS